jgi:hypothetical protein
MVEVPAVIALPFLFVIELGLLVAKYGITWNRIKLKLACIFDVWNGKVLTLLVL